MRGRSRAVGFIVISVSTLALDVGRAAPAIDGHFAATREANAELSNWLVNKRRWASRRVEGRATTDDHIDYHLAFHARPISAPKPAEAEVARRTKALYDEIFPRADPASRFGTFFESANPWIETPRGGYQWNSLRASGIDARESFDAAVARLTKLGGNPDERIGFRSIRIGPNLFEIDPERPESWSTFLDKIEVLWAHGVTPTVSLAFFPSLARWQTRAPDGTLDRSRSHLLHPDFPTDLGRMADGFMRGLWARAERFEAAHPGRRVHVVINPINEPETLAAFNREYWHGGYPPSEATRFYVSSVVSIAEAAVRVRLAVERASHRRVLFLHNEALTKETYPSHGGGGRFAVSKFALGDEVLTAARLEEVPCGDIEALSHQLDSRERDEVVWALRSYVFGAWNGTDEARSAACEELLGRLKTLRALHARLADETGKTMKTDTMLHLDYYCQTEFEFRRSVDAFVDELSANHGARLKQIAGISNDDAFVAWIDRQVVEAERRFPGVQLARVTGRRRSELDLRALLHAGDDALLSAALNLRREYRLRDEDVYRERQLRVGLRPAIRKLERTDALIEELSADDGRRLREVLGVQSHRAMVEALRDAAPSIRISPGDSARAILTRDGRDVLHRLLGLEFETRVGFEPTHYARQVRAGLRRGLYELGREYIEALRIYTIGVAESGTPYYAFAPLLHDQLMMEYVALLDSGVYGTQYAFGPALDTRGWSLGPLSHPPDEDFEINPCGILMLDSFLPRTHEDHERPWAELFLAPLYRELRERSAAKLTRWSSR